MRRLIFLTVLLVAFGTFADDGAMLRRNIPSTPELDTEHAAIKMMPFYVPAQSSDGVLLEAEGIDYFAVDGSVVMTRPDARPLVGTYQDGHVDSIEGLGFKGHGERDAFAAVSLDDGQTWKRKNLSNSGDLSSFSIKVRNKWIPYPGDVVTMFTALEENKVLIAWASRYCQGGSPTYAITDEEKDALVAFDATLASGLLTVDGIDYRPYLDDLFGVGGSQRSSDFADEGYPEVGEVPFSCLWAARGTLEMDDETGLHNVVWRKAERLTSGVRDVNRVETACEPGAGCVITWQEDPDGLRPGEGEGPGEGWSGAIAHHKTDIWYSYVDWDHFDLVDDPATDELGDPIELIEFEDEGEPKVGIPTSIPVRLTDNAMCTYITDPLAEGYSPYCVADLDGSGGLDVCETQTDLTITDVVSGEQTTILDVCVAEDGRLMRGNTASTRARLNLRGYDVDGDGVFDSAWVVTAYEESKGLGEEEVDAAVAMGADPGDLTKVDMGKNIWYHTFDMFSPELVSQGLMLNAPAQYYDDFAEIGSLVSAGDADFNYMLTVPDPIYFDQAGIDTTTLYQTEIARRFSLVSQTGAEAGTSGTVAFAMWKQGIIRRGGPADVMARRFVRPVEFDEAVDNPFAYDNMVCDNWDFVDGDNPRYVKGLCLEPTIALSTTSILDCDIESDGLTCADLFPWDAYFSDIEGGIPLAKVKQWVQIGPDFGQEPDLEANNLDDNSWDNPYDVAKGHRGFINGDFIMVLYAWSPNWHDNTVGHDNYNLYVRRSFDGGVTWTTTPATFTHTDDLSYSGAGNTTCEWMEPVDTGLCAGTFVHPSGECAVCTDYGAGDFEQARNISQLVGSGETILDPRYAPTAYSITADSVPEGFEAPAYTDDLRDPSRFFIVYETGDNTTVEFGEAEPLDLYYSRAINWGDDYELADVDGDGIADVVPDGDYWEIFDWLEGSSRAMSGEAAVAASPGGQFFYAIWNQEDLDKHENVIGSDAWFRRVMELDSDLGGVDGVTAPSGGTIGDDGGDEEPPDDDDSPGNSGDHRNNP